MRDPVDTATLQRMQLRCGKCRTLFEVHHEENLEINLFVKWMRSIRCVSCQGDKLLMGQGRTLSEDRNFDWDGSYDERVSKWARNGEFGNSSKAIWGRLSGFGAISSAHPQDLGDLRRCLLLLERVPEWKGRIGEMAAASDVWGRLAPRWEEIHAIFVEEAGTNLDSVAAPRTGALLKEIVDGKTE